MVKSFDTRSEKGQIWEWYDGLTREEKREYRRKHRDVINARARKRYAEERKHCTEHKVGSSEIKK